jgi:hypothetical protein
LRVQPCVSGRRIVTGKEARLKLPYPVPTHHEWWRLSAFEFKFIEMPIVEATETRRKAAKIVDQRKLRRDDVNHGSETGFLGELQALLGFVLHVGKRIADRQKPVIQIDARIRRKREIADAIGGTKRSTVQVPLGAQMSGPRDDENNEIQVCPGLESLEPAPFYKVIT